MLAYILLSIVLPASVIFVFSTVTSIPIWNRTLNPSYFLLSPWIHPEFILLPSFTDCARTLWTKSGSAATLCEGASRHISGPQRARLPWQSYTSISLNFHTCLPELYVSLLAVRTAGGSTALPQAPTQLHNWKRGRGDRGGRWIFEIVCVPK